ncbi:hypothetical protein T484DRAFT_1820068, partial [Baffinella frigidus]
MVATRSIEQSQLTFVSGEDPAFDGQTSAANGSNATNGSKGAQDDPAGREGATEGAGDAGVTVKGSYSTKIMALVLAIKRLPEDEK